MKQNRYIVWVLVGVILIAGVVLVINRPQGQEGIEPVLVEDGELEPTRTQVQPTETTEIVQNPTEEVEEPTPTTAIPPTPRTEMEGTDPTTVNLASGDIQLVEIFAFW